jgi:RNA recognition motif-containing protein
VGYAPVSNTRDNPPCNTLFVGNLGFDVQEADLQALFGAQPVGCSRDGDVTV